jgi:hypothetical protein
MSTSWGSPSGRRRPEASAGSTSSPRPAGRRNHGQTRRGRQVPWATGVGTVTRPFFVRCAPRPYGTDVRPRRRAGSPRRNPHARTHDTFGPLKGRIIGPGHNQRCGRHEPAPLLCGDAAARGHRLARAASDVAGWLAAGWRHARVSLDQLMTSVSLPMRVQAGYGSEATMPVVSLGRPRVSAGAARGSGRMRRGRLRRRGVSRSAGPCGARWGAHPLRRDVVRSSST